MQVPLLCAKKAVSRVPSVTQCKDDVHCAMLPSPLLWTAKERGDGLTQVDFPKEVSKDDLGMSGCHSCMGRTAEHMALTLRMWAVPR